MSILNLNEFAAEAALSNSARMPVLFVGHGSPMNAIEDNEFSRGWKKITEQIEKPKAILCVSAHWMTHGSMVTAMDHPQTIHDFYGFPQPLFDAHYAAPGAPELAKETAGLIKSAETGLSHDWGLDHGCWSVLLQMYPDADIPTYQLSLDMTKPPSYHFQLGKELMALRDKGVLILGSGNIVHNLGKAQWKDVAFDWAIEFDSWIQERIEAGDHEAAVAYDQKGSAAKLSIPTNEHYLPLLYTLGLRNKDENIRFFNEKVTLGAISMRSLLIGG